MALYKAFSATLVSLIFVMGFPAAPSAQAQTSLPTGTSDIIRILITRLQCTVTGTSDLLNSPFPSATVLVRLGSTLVASAMTDSTGSVNITVNTSLATVPQLLFDGTVTVPTPVSSCNPELPSSGRLVADLRVLNTIVSGLLGGTVTQLVTNAFSLVPALL